MKLGDVGSGPILRRLGRWLAMRRGGGARSERRCRVNEVCLPLVAGTITPAAEHLEWRKRVKEWARDNPANAWFDRCLVIDPTDRNDMRNVTKDGLHDTTMPDSLFVQADIADVQRADVVVCVYWKASTPAIYCLEDGQRYLTRVTERRQSIGTWCEFMVAAYLHKPIIVVTDDPSVSEHPFVKVYASAVHSTIGKGLEALEVLVK
jgi:hypothetical protein